MAPIDSSGVSLAAGLRWFCKLCTRVHNSKVRTRVSSGSKFACVFWKLLLKISHFWAKINFAEESAIPRKNSIATATKSRKKPFYNVEIYAFKITEQHPASIFPSQFFPVLHNLCAIFSQFVSQNGLSYISYNFTSNNSTPNNTVSYKLHFL